MAATVYVLVRGVIAMASGKDGTGEQRRNGCSARVLFQAVAIVLVILILLSPARRANNRTRLVKLNKIYTRTGDGGSAGLVDGSRVSKSSLRMAAIGEVDEANAAIGVAIAALDRATSATCLRDPERLFDLGADVATPGEVEGALRIVPRRSSGWSAKSTR